MSWLKAFSPYSSPSAWTPTSASTTHMPSMLTEVLCCQNHPKHWSKWNIALCTSTPPVPSPEHCSVTSVLPLLPACKGLIQHLNVPQRHILPAPMLAMGNIKHSGDCCYFIIYEALVISYINNPWLQSVAGTAIEYSWGILVENFHHQFKASH